MNSGALRRIVVALVGVFLGGCWGGVDALAEEPLAILPLRLAFLPFVDEAGFQGRWELAREVPDLLGQHLAREGALSVVPMDSVEVVLRIAKPHRQEERGRALDLGKRLGADLVITGRVQTFGVRRFSAGDPNSIGYKSYRSQIEIADVQLIRVATGEVVETFAVARDSVERPFALDLFGRPRQQDQEFRELFEVEFGSPRFYELPFGQLVDGVFADLSARIVHTLVERPPLDLDDGQALVLAVDAQGVYLGIGSENRVEYGDLLPIYRGEIQIAVVEVDQIIGPRLCKARIVDGKGEIGPGNRIGQRLSRKRSGD